MAQERIVVGNETTTRDEVEGAAGYAVSVMAGFETAVACARLLLPDLARHLDRTGINGTQSIADLRVRSAIARNGLWVWDTTWRGGRLEVVLEGVDLDGDLHRVLAGLLSAYIEAPNVEEWRLSIRDSDVALVVRRDAAAAARALLPPDTEQTRIDVNVLLPLLAGAKIADGESADAVAAHAVRLALNHPLGMAQDEARAIVARDDDALVRLINALAVVERALLATWEVVGRCPQRHPQRSRRRAHGRAEVASRHALRFRHAGAPHQPSARRLPRPA